MSNMQEFHKFMDGYVRHAGEWHDEGCAFVYYDHGVCNCECYKNKGEIEQFISKFTPDDE